MTRGNQFYWKQMVRGDYLLWETIYFVTVQTFAHIFYRLNALPVTMAAIFIPNKHSSMNVKVNQTVRMVVEATLT